MSLTADDLIVKVCQRAYWDPVDGNGPLSFAQILSIADEELAGELWPQVIAAQGDYYITHQDYALTLGQRRYRLPANAYGPIRDVLWFQDFSDPENEGVSVPQLDVEELGRADRFRATGRSGLYHYFEGDFFGILPNPTATQGIIRVRYFMRPGKLTLLANSSFVTAVDLTNNKLTIAGAGGSWAAGQIAGYYDVIGAGNAHQLIIDRGPVIVVQASPVRWTFDTTVLLLSSTGVAASTTGAANGADYVAAAGYTPVVQLPDFMLAQFIRRVTAECLRAAGEEANAEAEARAATRLAERERTIQERSEAEPHIITCRNSPIRASRSWR